MSKAHGNPHAVAFHAACLDGLRGFAALTVVWEHTSSDDFFKDDLYSISCGLMGLTLFFVLSAFLITFLTLADWDNWVIRNYGKVDQPHDPSYQEQIDNVASVEDRTSLPRSGLNIWGKYFTRRFFRVYPPYALLVTLILFIPFLNTTYSKALKNDFNWNQKMYMDHILLTEGSGIFDTIPIEMKFYILVPPMILLYVGLGRLCARMFSSFSPNPSARIAGDYTGKLICVILLLSYRIWQQHNPYWITEHLTNDYSLIGGRTHFFMDGSLGAFFYYELLKLHFVPKSLEQEEKESEQEKQRQEQEKQERKRSKSADTDKRHGGIDDSDIDVDPEEDPLRQIDGDVIAQQRKEKMDSSVYSLISHIEFPSLHTCIRGLFDVVSWILGLLLISFYVHHLAFYWYDVDKNKKTLYSRIQSPYASLVATAFVIACLLSRNGTMKDIFEWQPFRTVGKYSFSVYLLHLIPLCNRTTFASITPFAKNAENAAGNKSLGAYAFDQTIIAYLFIALIAYVYFNAVERLSMNTGTWIITNVFTDKKPDKKAVEAAAPTL